MPEETVAPEAPPYGPETGLSLPVAGVAQLLAPWRSSALSGSSPHHVTILYPWLALPITAGMVQSLDEVAASIEPFDATLTSVATFDSGVVFLTPEPVDHFRALVELFCERFPTCEPYHGLEPIPHLTAARVPPGLADPVDGLARLAEEVHHAIRAHLPIPFRVEGMSLGQSDEQGRWSRHSYHRFGAESGGPRVSSTRAKQAP